jgi:hypothetical protein
MACQPAGLTCVAISICKAKRPSILSFLAPQVTAENCDNRLRWINLGTMFASKTSCAILALAGTAMAFPSASKRDNTTMTVFESVSGPPAEWVQDAVNALTDDVLELRIGLALSNLEQFDQMALDVRPSPVPFHYCISAPSVRGQETQRHLRPQRSMVSLYLGPTRGTAIGVYHPGGTLVGHRLLATRMHPAWRR